MELLRRFLENELRIEADTFIPQFQKYETALLDWNERINLVSRKTRTIEEHILNSIFFLSKADISGAASLADIGTGGGFPGIPLKIILPMIRVTLIDSIRKKITALDGIIAEAGFTGINTVCSRVESLANVSEYRESLDVITAKAVAPLDKLYEWSAKLLATNGRMIFIKGGDIDEELADLKKITGNSIIEVVTFDFDPVYGIEDKKTVIINKSSES